MNQHLVAPKLFILRSPTCGHTSLHVIKNSVVGLCRVFFTSSHQSWPRR